MPPHTSSQVTNILNIWGVPLCRYLALNEKFKTLHQRCFGCAKCLSKNQDDHPNNRIKTRSESNSTHPGLTTFTSKVESSNNPQSTHDFVSSTQEQQSNMTTPIIVLNILFVFFFLLFLLFLFWRRRRAQYFNNSLVKKGETFGGRSLSLESTLLSHNRISEESNGLGSARSKSSSVSLEDVPIPDIEKELIVEPSLNKHPAFKFIDVTNPYPHHPGTRVAIPEIPSPLPSPVHQQETMSKRMSYHTPDKALSAIAKSEGPIRKNSLANLDASLWSKERLDRDDSNSNACESLKSDVEPLTPSSISEMGHQGRCEIIKEGSDEASVREDLSKLETDSETNSEIETYPWHELFSKITRSKSPELRTKDINQVVNKSSVVYLKKTAPITQDISDQIHLMSNRWSNSTVELPDSSTNTGSDWYIPGSWVNSTRLDDDNTRANKNKTSSGPDTSDANQNFSSQRFIYLNLRSENNSPNPSVLDCSEKIGAKNECNDNDNTAENNDNPKNNLETGLNDSGIERSGTRVWRKWLKR
ncbi:hypothetical protein OnM2_097021 [Erysiphe neolycopersici]|uniref:Uncharacterized protein n=1 Tax=Erysiphe neolycopersici TaxID=212602 RepID=A0A420HAN4_9PEZI|nr:hypothetical protein OnM2_097021 [Erysiphe neolycopersici]